MMGRTSLKLQQVIDQHLASNTASRATLFNFFEGSQTSNQNFLTGTRSKAMQPMIPMSIRSPQNARGSAQGSSCLPDIVNQCLQSGPSLHNGVAVSNRDQMIQSHEVEIQEFRMPESEMQTSKRKAPFKNSNNKQNRKSKMSKSTRGPGEASTPMEEVSAHDVAPDLEMKNIDIGEL